MSSPTEPHAALFTSRPISVIAVARRIVFRKSGRAMSIVIAAVSMSYFSFSFAACARIISVCTSASATFNPRAASCAANSAPIPEAPPVTRAHGPYFCLNPVSFMTYTVSLLATVI